MGRVVTSGGNTIRILEAGHLPSTTLIMENISGKIFPRRCKTRASFTTISSNGTQAGTAVILDRAGGSFDVNGTREVMLGFDASDKTLTLACRHLAGNRRQRDIVPVAVNGSIRREPQGTGIFGLAGAPARLLSACVRRPLRKLAPHHRQPTGDDDPVDERQALKVLRRRHQEPTRR